MCNRRSVVPTPYLLRHVWFRPLEQRQCRRKLADADNIILSAAASARRSNYEPAESYLYRRTAGSPWQQLRDGLPEPAGRRTAVLASHPREPGMFFAAWERDVYHSVDGGASFCRLDVPWPENCRINEICALAIAEDQLAIAEYQ
jgi:hypothetical protein